MGAEPAPPTDRPAWRIAPIAMASSGAACWPKRCGAFRASSPSPLGPARSPAAPSRDASAPAAVMGRSVGSLASSRSLCVAMHSLWQKIHTNSASCDWEEQLHAGIQLLERLPGSVRALDLRGRLQAEESGVAAVMGFSSLPAPGVREERDGRGPVPRVTRNEHPGASPGPRDALPAHCAPLPVSWDTLADHRAESPDCPEGPSVHRAGHPGP